MSDQPQTPLEPCPFCGSRCVTLLNGGPGNYFVRCDDCSASSNDVQKDHAVQLWNTRSEQPTPLSPDSAAAINQLIDYADDLDATERPAIGDYDVTADIRSVCEFIRARAVQPDVREALKAAIRAAKLALFVIHKQDVMPNSSWESGFNSDISKAEAALAAPPARSSDETAEVDWKDAAEISKAAADKVLQDGKVNAAELQVPYSAGVGAIAIACIRRLARCNIDNPGQRELAGDDILSTLQKIEALSRPPSSVETGDGK